MGFFGDMNEKIKTSIRNWLNVQPYGSHGLQITEVMDFELSAIRNRIWYRGDGNELEQLYQQSPEYADRYKFWGSKSTPGLEMRKIHTGLPSLIIKVLTDIVLADMNELAFDSGAQELLWMDIEKQNHFRKRIAKAVRETLCIGDGAWKLSMDTGKKPLPIISWYPGDRIEIIREGDAVREVIFKTPYEYGNKHYTLLEHYGYGYIYNELYCNEELMNTTAIPQTAGIKDVKFDSSVILAVPLMVYESAKYDGRGGSIFDNKLDSFDALDEAWSQWMDALRAGRAKTYIPEALVPRNPENGMLMRPNSFDNRFIRTDTDMGEQSKNQIVTEQPAIPHDGYLATYITALDLCLQGIISPSTLGIDVKKLDNSEAQREKEKTTLYTRNAIVEALQETLPDLIAACINCINLTNQKAIEDVKVDVPFGEYANPSFESQVETVAKAKQGGIMSTEASVEELYGDTRDEKWKEAEVARIKAERGVEALSEPSLSMKNGDFTTEVVD